MCGIFGVYGCKNVFGELVSGLTTLQHRGQDAAGIVTLDRSFHMKKGEGLASQVFLASDEENLTGKMGLGHIRYSTQGSTQLSDAQPLTVNYPFGLAMVHNGNVTNFQPLKHYCTHDNHRLLETSNDIELILGALSVELVKKSLPNLSVEEIFEAVESLQKKVKGAFSTITLIANHGMLAFKDPYGIRPLLLGKKESSEGISYAFASESRCFDYLGYDLIHDLQAGEAIFIDKDKRIHSKQCLQKKRAFCIFEYIYFSKEDSIIHDRLVATEREKLGAILAKQFKKQKLNPDVVIDVPSSSYFYAQGLSKALNLPYRRGLIKNNFNSRSFISPTRKLREKIVKQKLNPIKAFIEGKKVALIDDSIVRGTTSRHIVEIVKNAGAKEVYFTSGSPPIKNPCLYGIDMSKRDEMIASKHSIEEIRRYINAEAVIYPSLEDLRGLYGEKTFCDACFSGDYPTGVTKEEFLAIERDKILACR